MHWIRHQRIFTYRDVDDQVTAIYILFYLFSHYSLFAYYSINLLYFISHSPTDNYFQLFSTNWLRIQFKVLIYYLTLSRLIFTINFHREISPHFHYLFPFDLFELFLKHYWTENRSRIKYNSTDFVDAQEFLVIWFGIEAQPQNKLRWSPEKESTRKLNP